MEGDGECDEVRIVVECSEDKVNRVNFSWKWGEDEFPIVDRYTHLLA